MTEMGVTDIVSPILGAGRTMAMNNFQYINPVNIYKNLQKVPNISEQFQIPTGIKDSNLAKKIKSIFEEKQQPVKSKTIEGVDENVPPEQQSEQTSASTAKIIGIVFLVITYVIALGMISFVINDMIMHPWMVRLIMTLVLVIITILNPLTPYAILLYYLLNGMWKYYLNSTLPPSEEKRIIPFIYGFLPYTTKKASTTIGKIFLAPFSYDPDDDMDNMKWDRKEWLKTLLASFPDAKETLSIGGMNGLFKEYQQSLDKIHEFVRVVKTGDTESEIVMSPFTAAPKPTEPEKPSEDKPTA
jgi:hypothetical protein